MDQKPRICDYEDSSYRTDFWDGQGREYEDRAERIAIRHLLPPSGRRLLDIGGGFGRLSEFYEGYDQVVLLDYSRSLLRQAQARLGDQGRIIYVAASFYNMPFDENIFDAALMVRVMHHVEQVPALLGEVGRVLTGDGTYVLEFANKRNLKAMLRYALGRQDWRPYEQAPHEFVEMNLNFHPTWMRARLAEGMFHVKRTRTVSHFRLAALKRLFPADFLAGIDGLLQPTGAWWQLTPSVFHACTPDKPPVPPQLNLRFRCPTCGSDDLQDRADTLMCTACSRCWSIEDGIHNFEQPVA